MEKDHSISTDLRRWLLKVHGNKGMVEMTTSYDIVPGAQSFPDLISA